MRSVVVAAIQTSFVDDMSVNHDRVERLIRQAAAQGANVVVPPELFSSVYFCKEELAQNFERAEDASDSVTVNRFARLARELNIVIPISFFERAGRSFFNSVALADATGEVMGVYRKSHIPDGPGYEEKYYFSPGDTGFRVFRTAHGVIGVGICWDQWFPECARAMALLGADILCYPTAIGSEPQDPTLDTAGHWRRVMQGHAGANMVPVVASNRCGLEKSTNTETVFYGTSFVADETGAIVADADRVTECVLVASFDLDAIAQARTAYGLFRDRRTDLYGPLLTLDGSHRRS